MKMLFSLTLSSGLGQPTDHVNKHLYSHGHKRTCFTVKGQKQGPFCVIGGPMQDAVWGPLFCQTMMDRFLTLLGDSQRCNDLLHLKRKTG